MRYTKFEISHYKGVKDTVVIDMAHLPSSKIYTLVGLNESGKTSILEAIELLQNDCPTGHEHEMIHVSQKGNYTGDISVSAELDLDEDDEQRIKDFCLENFDYVLTEPLGHVTLTQVYHFVSSGFKSKETLWDFSLVAKPKGSRARKGKDLESAVPGSWTKVADFINNHFPRILYYENFLFDFPDRIYLSSSKSVDAVKRTWEYRQVIQDVFDYIGDGRTVKEHLYARAKSDKEEDKSALEACLGDIEATLTQVIMQAWNKVFTTSGDEVAVTCGVESTNGPYLELKIKQGFQKYSISERSLGFRWFFSFLLFTQFRKAREDEFGETLFLLDEPASNLHPRSQQNLLRVFNEIAKDCKIVYSTHSHYLIDTKNLPAAYIVRNAAINYGDEAMTATQRDTSIQVTPYRQFAASHKDQRDHYRPILDAIDYVPSDLELTDDIVGLEGKNDFYTFKLMERIIRSGNTIKFYPGGSADSLDPMIRLLLAYNGNFLCILDADKGGRDAKSRYIKEFGPAVEGRVLTLADINPEWVGFTTENLFSATDRLAIIHTSFPEAKKYEKGKFNTAITQLYAIGQTFPFDEETTARFTQLFEAIDQYMPDGAQRVICPVE